MAVLPHPRDWTPRQMATKHVACKLANKLGDSFASGPGPVCLAKTPPRQNLSMRDVLEIIDERYRSEGVCQTTIVYKHAAAPEAG